jgi:cytochrome c oxidase subunit I+III
VVAHFHYVMFGGATALIGGAYYWFPKMTGKLYDEFLGKLHFVIFFVSFNMVYFSMFMAWETPRRVFVYSQDYVAIHQFGTVGGFLLGFSFLIMFYNFAKSMVYGEAVGDNPWEFTRTAEWAVPSPPPLENWEGRPSYATGRLEFLERGHATDGGEAAADGGHARGDDAGDYILGEKHPSHASIWPFGLSLATFVALLGASGVRKSMTITAGDHSVADAGLAISNPVYPALMLIGAIGMLYAGVQWGLEDFYAPPAEVASRWPFDGIEKNKLGMWFFLASDVLVFGAFISAAMFIRVNSGWLSWEPLPAEIPGLINTYVLLTSSFTVILALVYSKRQQRRKMLASLAATIGLGLTFLAIKGWEWHHEIYEKGITLTQNPHGPNIQSTLYYVTTGLHGIHVVLGLIVASFLLYRGFQGHYMHDHRPVEYFGLYWHFVDIVWVFLFPLFYLV